MEDNKRLKATHPHKYYLKRFCTFIYYLGGGNCWYTKKDVTKTVRIIYNTYAVGINAYALIVFFNQLLASCRSLTFKEKNDVLQFDIAHWTVCAKFVVLYLQKNRIRELLEKFLEEDREFASLEMEKASVRRALRYCIAMQGTVYMTLFTALLDGIRMHVKEGIPIRTEVVYYPNPSHSGIFVNILRVFIELHWWYVVSMMTCIDCLSVCSMVFLSCKFKILAAYFEGLRKKLLAHGGKRSLYALEEEYKKDFVLGIKLHQHILWYAQHVQYALGNLYSVQVIESMFLLVMCLIKLVAIERNSTFLLANMVYISCMVALLGGYMMAAGDVTHEASLLPNAIFNSGWELTRGSKELRKLVVVTLIRSQRPVVMTAFGILTLSYSNLIAVIRHSYSFFAVMY